MPLNSEKPIIDPNGRYSVTEAAKLLGVHRSTVWRWTHDNKLQPLCSKANNRNRYSGKDIIRLWQAEF